MTECNVISVVLVRAVQRVTFGAEGTGFETCYRPFFFLFSYSFIKRCYDKGEFDLLLGMFKKVK